MPYITHLMAVAALVGEYGGSQNQIVAALLHDAAEDAAAARAEDSGAARAEDAAGDSGGRAVLAAIDERFGAQVAGYVEACSDTLAYPKPPWRERKTAFIERLAGECREVKLLVAADKLHNARCTLRDLRREGPQVWTRFKGGRDGTRWYYRAVVDALARGWQHPILDELRETVSCLETGG